MLFGISWAEF